MSIDNLMLTEHAIKRHAKRLQKQMKNYNQDITLGESQTLLSKILGFNDWNHLNTILKPAIADYEKEIEKKNAVYNLVQTFFSNNEYFVYDLEFESIIFENNEQKTTNVQEKFDKLKNNILNYKNQNINLKDINLEFAKMLSTFPSYLIKKDSIKINYGGNIYDKQKMESINRILDFVSINQANIDFNIKSKEGLPLLAILLIYFRNGNGNQRFISEELKNSLSTLIDSLIKHTDLEQSFLLYGSFIELLFLNDITKNNIIIVKSFLKKINHIPEDFFIKFLQGSFAVIPEINLLKLLFKKTIKSNPNKYLFYSILSLLNKPYYIQFYSLDFSYSRNILKFILEKNYLIDYTEIREIILSHTSNIDNFEITNNIKFIIDCIPELMNDISFQKNLIERTKSKNDYNLYFIEILKLRKK